MVFIRLYEHRNEITIRRGAWVSTYYNMADCTSVERALLIAVEYIKLTCSESVRVRVMSATLGGMTVSVKHVQGSFNFGAH